jgi:hypothetical protein
MSDLAALEPKLEEPWLQSAAKVGLRRWGTATSALRPWPDFLLIGTKRGGTTSLFHYLRGHPDVLPMFPTRRLKSPHYFYWHFDRGERWYRSHFPTIVYRRTLEKLRHTTVISGEASPYYLYHPYTAERVRAAIPDVKLIVSLRNPVNRAYSHYWERFDTGVEPLSFADALAAETDRLSGESEKMAADPLYYSRAHDWYSYRDRGIYAPQLQRWFNLFPREQFLILNSDAFYADEQGEIDRVTDFLSLRRYPLPAKPQYNNRPAPRMDPAIHDELAAFYRPHNAQLYELLGEDLGWD